MSTIESCLAKIAATNMISEALRQKALDAYEAAKAGLGDTMGPVDADVAAALRAAEAMVETTKQEKLTVARNALTLAKNKGFRDSHPDGKLAGVSSLLAPDIREKAQWANVESLWKANAVKLQNAVTPMIEAFNSKWGGLRQDWMGMRDVIRERFKIDTGNAVAKQAWQAWEKMDKMANAMAGRAGLRFRSAAEREAWGIPQFWTSTQVAKLSAAKDNGVKGSYFVGRAMRWINEGGLEIIDEATGMVFLDKAKAAARIQQAWEHIVKNESPGTLGQAFNDNTRIFRFTNADAFLDMMDEFGIGQRGYYPALMAHISAMAKKVALAQILGPSYRANFRVLMDPVKIENNLAGLASKANPSRMFESVYLAENMFKNLTGDSHVVVSEQLAAAFAATRSMATAAKLPFAVISAVPGDTMTDAFARAHLGMPVMGAITGALKEIAASKTAVARATRLHVQAHGVIDHLGSAARFGTLDPNVQSNKLAELAMRAGFLPQWTHLKQRSFIMDLHGHIADQASRPLDQVNGRFRRNFLERYGLDKHWDELRDPAHLVDIEGGSFFNPGAIKDRALQDRVLSAIMDQRGYAILEGSVRSQARLAGNVPRGTWRGELMHSGTQFKQFVMSMAMTHLMRGMNRGTMATRLGKTAWFITAMTMAGAIAVQARSLMQGKDMRDMTEPMFWLDAAAMGGALSFYGDFAKGQLDPRYQGNNVVTDLIGGPAASLGKDVGTLTVGNLKDLLSGKSTSFGKDMVKLLRDWTPSTFYTKTPLDIWIFDQAQTLVDPDYRDAWRRQQRRLQQTTGQKRWWEQGEFLPHRAPQMP